MPKFSFKEKTGLSEVQWLQVFSGLLSLVIHISGHTEYAVYAGSGSTIMLGALGAYLRNKDKKK